MTSLPFFGARHRVVLLGFFGFFNVYAMRVNLSVAALKMSKEYHWLVCSGQWAVCSVQCARASSIARLPRLHEPSALVCCVADLPRPPTQRSVLTSTVPPPHPAPARASPRCGNTTATKNCETTGTILGSFFYGYILSQVVGGFIATRYGGKHVFGVGVLMTSVLTILTPFAARQGDGSQQGVLIALRVLEGIFEGVTFPAFHAVLGQYRPVQHALPCSCNHTTRLQCSIPFSTHIEHRNTPTTLRKHTATRRHTRHTPTPTPTPNPRSMTHA